MVVLKMAPYSLEFKPGQYAFVRLSFIDSSWHPSPSRQDQTRHLSNFTSKYSTSSLDWKMWQLINDNRAEEGRTVPFDVDLMGPYGTGLVRKEDFSHALAVGTGTGK
jgi:NAD(P)H-flavin reductase